MTEDCHDSHGTKDMCVAGAIQNFTNQLSHYQHGTSDRRRKKLINSRQFALSGWNRFNASK